MVKQPFLLEQLHLRECSSTNDLLRSIIQEEKEIRTLEGLFATTDFQTSGRGHGANQWHSSPGLNLLFSFLLIPDRVTPELQFDISRLISLGLIDTLSGLIPEVVSWKIKWPNDIYAGSGKIAGILIENAIMGSQIVYSVAGIGLNINESQFPRHIPNATSLYLLTQQLFDKNLVLDQFRETLTKRVETSDHTILHEASDALLYGKNTELRYEDEHGVFYGVVLGTTPEGLLRILVQDQERQYGFKEVALLG
jgi:BirA family transcriptional regulator, biotin operon repressor / biotin---[acetyl-CoA-carboxylase] ligase